MNPLDLPGPAFLALYAAVLGTAVVAALFLRWSLRGPGGEPPPEALALDPYEIAFLAGGAPFALNAAFASLCQRGVLAPDPSRRHLTVQADLEPDAFPAERAAFRLVREAPERTIAQLRAASPPPPGIADLGARLEARELWMTPQRFAAARFRPPLVVGAAVLLGVAKIIIGILRERPVVFLVALCLVGLVVTLCLLGTLGQRTRRGDRVLELLRLRNAALRAAAARGAATLAPRDLVFALGLFGFGVLYHGPLAPVALALQPPGSSAGGGGGGDGGGGCGGGGGGGGGGCGGCGGGGG